MQVPTGDSARAASSATVSGADGQKMMILTQPHLSKINIAQRAPIVTGTQSSFRVSFLRVCFRFIKLVVNNKRLICGVNFVVLLLNYFDSTCTRCLFQARKHPVSPLVTKGSAERLRGNTWTWTYRPEAIVLKEPSVSSEPTIEPSVAPTTEICHTPTDERSEAPVDPTAALTGLKKSKPSLLCRVKRALSKTFFS